MKTPKQWNNLCSKSYLEKDILEACHPQTHSKQFFTCIWKKNQIIQLFYESVSVVSFHLSHIYWLIYSDYALSESQWYLIYNTHGTTWKIHTDIGNNV